MIGNSSSTETALRLLLTLLTGLLAVAPAQLVLVAVVPLVFLPATLVAWPP